ncbi:hypothetical protein DY000_02026419 [Brassica cretica]|uniref:Uncharacterized protein n=1 Tax=Brassica cretica TaxID=69181 RepID=A0ABQ7EFQ4_BRACR|nr:hypothetical protein DY000_02026419 [Brassica cretica]
MFLSKRRSWIIGLGRKIFSHNGLWIVSLCFMVSRFNSVIRVSESEGDMSKTGQRKSGDQDCPESGELRWSKKCSVAAYTNLDENKIIWKKEGGFDPYIDFSCANIASKFTAKSTRQCRRRFGYNDVFLELAPEEDACYTSFLSSAFIEV